MKKAFSPLAGRPSSWGRFRVLESRARRCLAPCHCLFFGAISVRYAVRFCFGLFFGGHPATSLRLLGSPAVHTCADWLGKGESPGPPAPCLHLASCQLLRFGAIEQFWTVARNRSLSGLSLVPACILGKKEGPARSRARLWLSHLLVICWSFAGAVGSTAKKSPLAGLHVLVLIGAIGVA